jgi:FlaA1/EpsC-like NDP-sugar epimerase
MANAIPLLLSLFRYLLPARTGLLFVAYSCISAASIFLAYALRFEFYVEEPWRTLRFENLTWIVPLKLLLLFAFGQFGGLLSYFRLPDLYRVFSAMGMAAFILLTLWYMAEGQECPPRSVIAGDFIGSFSMICAFRVFLRVLRERSRRGATGERQRYKRTAIIGAGDVGATIAADLLSRPGFGLRPVVFLDDDRRKWKKHIHGISVVDSPDNLAVASRNFGFEEVIIAMPSASARRIREVIDQAKAVGLKAEIVPSLAELTTGKVRADRVRPVDIEDLLGRDPVALESDNIRRMLQDRRVLVTGAGGSIGAELCRQIAFHRPEALLLLEQSEDNLFRVESALRADGYESIVHPLVADVLDSGRVRAILKDCKPDLIFHAAAHKHVYMMERQPGEAIKNNTGGTVQLADLAVESGVDRFIFISTDKAINPTNVMGASKRLAEIYLQAKDGEGEGKTRFMAVRFGNVLGSSGSVVPIFREQIARGGPVTVTHPDATRYFMTIPEAVGLVLQSASQGEGGEIFVLDMGSPVKIANLARQMIELSGFRPEEDIEIVYIGLRPGEKLFEELQHLGETLEPTRHPGVMRFVCDPQEPHEVRAFIDGLLCDIDGKDSDFVMSELKRFLPEYTPSNG